MIDEPVSLWSFMIILVYDYWHMDHQKKSTTAI